MSEEKVWGIHTQDDRLFLEDNVIAIGWHEIGDLSIVENNRESFKEKYKSGFKFINRTGSSRAWEFLIPEDARYFLPEIKENAKK